MIDIDLFDYVSSDNVQAIKEVCEDGRNSAALKKVMTLGQAVQSVDNPGLRGTSILFLAVVNRSEKVLAFIIEAALQHPETARLLAALLQERNINGRTVLHEAACVDGSADVIRLLGEAAKSSEKFSSVTFLRKWINQQDNLGRAALHYAARQVEMNNYNMLLDLGADEYIKSRTGMLPIEYIRYGDPDHSFDFLKKWILTSKAGAEFFKAHHGCEPQEIPDILDKLIKIDLDIFGVNEADLQRRAFEATIAMLLPVPPSPKEAQACFYNFSFINFSQIPFAGLPSEGEGEHYDIDVGAKPYLPSGALQLLDVALRKSQEIKDSEMRNLFVKAEILRQLTEDNVIDQELFGCYFALVKDYPKLALEGMKKLDVSLVNPHILANALVEALVAIHIGQIPEKAACRPIRLFGQIKDQRLTQKLLQLQKSVVEAVEVQDKISLIQVIPAKKGRLLNFKNDLLTVFQHFNLLPSVSPGMPGNYSIQ